VTIAGQIAWAKVSIFGDMVVTEGVAPVSGAGHFAYAVLDSRGAQIARNPHGLRAASQSEIYQKKINVHSAAEVGRSKAPARRRGPVFDDNALLTSPSTSSQICAATRRSWVNEQHGNAEFFAATSSKQIKHLAAAPLNIPPPTRAFISPTRRSGFIANRRALNGDPRWRCARLKTCGADSGSSAIAWPVPTSSINFGGIGCHRVRARLVPKVIGPFHKRLRATVQRGNSLDPVKDLEPHDLNSVWGDAAAAASAKVGNLGFPGKPVTFTGVGSIRTHNGAPATVDFTRPAAPTRFPRMSGPPPRGAIGEIFTSAPHGTPLAAFRTHDVIRPSPPRPMRSRSSRNHPRPVNGQSLITSAPHRSSS